MLNKWGYSPKVLGYIPNVRGVITGLPENSTLDLSSERVLSKFSSEPTVQMVEPDVSRILLPAPWIAQTLGVRYWRRR